jgi:hypothetical protein
MISLRYITQTCVLVSFALVPTVLHTYVGFTAPDGRTTAQVASALEGTGGTDTGRDTAWVQHYFHTEDFFERRYVRTGVTLFVARGFDAKAFYHHPELGLAYGRPFTSTEVVQVAGRSGSVVLHVLRGSDDLACYALLYGDQFVASPWRFEARRAIAMLVSPQREMSLFFAHGPAASDANDSPVTRIVLTAVDNFRAPATSHSE